jgi:hypothetical protein
MTVPHLDDESLSAAIDGEATAAETAHLSTCSQCRAGLEARATVARAVGAPVTPRPAAAVDDAIRQALDAWPDAAMASPAATARPLAPAVVGPGVRSRPSRHWMAGVAGIAAAVVVVGGIVAVTRQSKPSRTTASSSSLAAGASVSSTTAPAFAAQPGSRDLGEQSDAAVVAQLVTAAQGAAGATPNLAVPGITSTVSRDRGASPDLTLPPCVTEARSAIGARADSATVALVATLRWRGQPAVVDVFAVPGGQAGVIMTAEGCSFLSLLPL